MDPEAIRAFRRKLNDTSEINWAMHELSKRIMLYHASRGTIPEYQGGMHSDFAKAVALYDALMSLCTRHPHDITPWHALDIYEVRLDAHGDSLG
jgi:hypothetical protein